jgi:hypothetical protein
MPSSIFINPIDNGTNVITAVDAAQPIIVSGTEAGLDGQDMLVALFSDTTEQPVATNAQIAANASWSVPLPVPEHLANGAYTLVVENSDGTVSASEAITVKEIYSNVSWTRGVSGDFATASNWTPAGIPGPADDVTIGARGTYTVTSSADELVGNLTISNNHAALFITGASTFTEAFGGTNDGTVIVDSGSALNVGTVGGSTTLANMGGNFSASPTQATDLSS